MLVSVDEAGDELIEVMNASQLPHVHDPQAPRFVLTDTEGNYALGIGGYVRAVAEYDFGGIVNSVDFIPALIKLFTGIYVASTAISLALAMTLFMVFHIKLAPGYPEYNRDRILIFHGADFNDVGPLPPTQITKYMGIHLSGGFATEVIANIDGIERIALTASPEMSFDPSNIRTEGSDKCIDWSADAICVDDNYWKTFGFEFISGAPFTKEELNDAKAVISESYARALFARTDVAGEKMILDGHGECTIVGVVKDAPECMELTCYDIFFPLNYINLKGSYDKWDGIHGHYEALITYSPGADVDNIKKEIEERYHRYSQEYIKNEGFTKFDYDISIYRNWEKALATGGRK